MLTETKCRAARPRSKAYKLTDANRLYLLVTPTGGKLWRWGYSFDGKQKSLAFGAFPAITLADARVKRDEAYTLLCEGRDPSIAKKLKLEETMEAARQTFEKLAREWYDNAKAQWASVHASDVIRSLERDVFPTIGALPIAQLTPPLILGVLREIESRGSIETAKRIRQRISAVFVYAIAQGIAASDPAEKLGAVLKPLRKGRQPAITKIESLRKMIIAAEEDFARPITRLALRLLALTAVRPNELRGAEWAEFEGLNEEEPLWRRPNSYRHWCGQSGARGPLFSARLDAVRSPLDRSRRSSPSCDRRLLRTALPSSGRTHPTRLIVFSGYTASYGGP